MNQAKSMLGAGEDTSLVDNGFPGPDRYMVNSMNKVPGFVLKPPNEGARRTDSDI